MLKIIFFMSISLTCTLKVVKADDGPTSLPSTMNDLDREIMITISECNETFRIEMSYIKALNDNGSFPDETDKTPKCYLRCLMMKLAIMSEDGAFNTQRAAQVFTSNLIGGRDDQMEEFARDCSNKNEACKCERAYSFSKCVKEKSIAKNKKKT